MTGSFVPVDLGPARQADTRNVQRPDGTWVWPGAAPDRSALAELPWGDRTFYGLPFALGTGCGPGAAAVVAAAAPPLPTRVTVPLIGRARALLLAHACSVPGPQSEPPDGVGQVVGAYRLHYADGTVVQLDLRRRFEIHSVTIPWGHRPFLCRNCREFAAVPLGDAGDSWGRVQTGITTAAGHEQQGWWLLAWEHPHPELPMAQLELVAADGAAVALGGLTLSRDEADPLAWLPREELAVTVDGDDEPLQVEIDRGVVARKDRLLVPGTDWLGTDETGWGDGRQAAHTQGYVEVHAAAEARLRLRSGAIEEQLRWADVVQGGPVQRGRVRVEKVAPRGRQWVHVRIADADTQRPVGARIHFRTQNGAYLAPHGHQADVNTGWFEDVGGDCKVRGVPYAYVDGTCQIELPVGPVLIEIVRGFEYEPMRQRVEIRPGQRHLNLSLQRAFDMKSRRFYSGDTHVHFLSSQSAHLEAAAEDLNVVNLLASQWGRLFTSWEEFTGGLAPTSSPEHQIWVSQENRQHVLGHISLLGLRSLVAPMCTGGPQEDWIGGETQTLLADWAAECRAQGGLVVIPHLPLPDFENAADVILGLADAGELCWVWEGEPISSAERAYYRWLNVGQRLPVVGGTDKMANDRVIGGSRTYARLRPDEEFTYDNWCNAVRRGDTFASTGAMIDLHVEGRGMGQVVALPGGGGTVEIEAQAESVWPLTALSVLVNGVEVARATAGAGDRRLQLHHRCVVNASSWVVARCWGPYLTNAGPVMAHSSPVYLDLAGRGAFVAAEGTYLLNHLQGSQSWAERLGVFRDEDVRRRLLDLLAAARTELERRAR